MKPFKPSLRLWLFKVLAIFKNYIGKIWCALVRFFGLVRLQFTDLGERVFAIFDFVADSAWFGRAHSFLLRTAKTFTARAQVALTALYDHTAGLLLARALKKSAEKENRKFPFKTKALALLCGEKKEDIVFPLTEEEKTKLLKGGARRSLKVLGPLLGAAAVIAVIFTAKEYMLGVKVIMDGKEVGVLASVSDFEKVQQSVEEYISVTTGEPYKIEVSPQFKDTFVKRDMAQNTKGITDELYGKAADVVAPSFGLYVDKRLVAVNPNDAGIDDALEGVLKTKASMEGARTEFVQTVEVKKGLMPKKMEMSLLEISEALTTESRRQDTYTVNEGDTAESITASYGMTKEELKALNSDAVNAGLKAGQRLKVLVRTQPLSIKFVKTQVRTEEIPFSTIETPTSSLYKEQTKIYSEGEVGSVSISDDVTYIDGVEQERTEILREVTNEATDKVVLVGTKPLPAKSATGSMRRPVGGIISAPYGRYSSGRPHTGVDFANDTGTPVVAADGGKVVSAGWSGSYGYAVVIDHGNGLKTRYAHNSKLLCSAGERVAKGEVISLVGSTGNSTGPHCHFEVMKNGAFQNPWNYIS